MMTPMEGDEPSPGWALPGTAADVGSDGWTAPTPVAPGPPPSSGGTRTPDDRGGGWIGDVPVLGLRPMTVADILDGGFGVLKARPRRILGLTALFVVPAQLLIAYLQRDAAGGLGLSDFWTSDPTILNESSDTVSTGEVVAFALAIVIPALALVCVAAAIAHLVSAWSVGRDPDGRELLGVVGRRWWPLLASFVLVKLAEAVGLLGCYVGIVFVMPLWVSVAPVIAVEGLGPVDAMRRSARLTGQRYWPVLGIALLMGLVSTLVGQALTALPQGLAAWIGYDSGWPLLALGGIIEGVIMTPFVAAATVLLYLDLRVRSEGLDIELDVADVFDSAAS